MFGSYLRSASMELTFSCLSAQFRVTEYEVMRVIWRKGPTFVRIQEGLQAAVRILNATISCA